MKKVGVDDFLKVHSKKDFLGLRKIKLAASEFDGFEEWYAQWRLKKYDSDAYITPIASESKWIAADKLAEETPLVIDWIWEPFIAKGWVTLLSSAPKAGKTTLVNHFLKHLTKAEPFLGREIKPVRKILILTEEPATLLLQRFGNLDLIKNSLLILLRYKLSEDWREALSQISLALKKEPVDLVIIDTLAEFWDVKDENSSQDVMRTLKPLKKIVHESNTAMLLIHHLRKDTKGEKGSGHRGSSAITGTAEINLELREESRETFRKLESRSRYWETPKALLIELDNGVYRCHGSPEAFKKEEVEKQILKVLSDAPAPLTRKEIIQKLNPKPSESNVKNILSTSPLIKFEGDGKRGQPRRYRKAIWTSTPPLRASKSKQTKEGARDPKPETPKTADKSIRKSGKRRAQP